MRFLFLLSVLLAFHVPLKAVDGTVDYLGLEHGLSNNAVNCIYQDSYGFMWFGTYNGLNRYDGYSFKVFRSKLKDSTSLCNNWIVAIKEDANRNIWVGTKGGLNVYNLSAAKFNHAVFRLAKGPDTKNTTTAVNALATDKSGNMFVATAGDGLLMFGSSKPSGQQIAYPTTKGDVFNLHVTSVKTDNLGKIWAFVEGYGLCFYDYKKQELVLKSDIVTRSKSIEPDQFGNIWIGTEHGVYAFNILSEKIAHYNEANGFLLNNNVNGITADKKGQVWITTDGGGVAIYNPLNKDIKHLTATEGSLTSSAVSSVYEDREQRMWIGTLRGGINIIDSKRHRFRTVSQNGGGKKTGLISNFILSFCEDENRNLWIGTDGEGISYWNRNSNTFSNYVHRKNDPNSLSNNNVASIVRDYKSDIWVATYGGGVSKFNKTSKTFKYYPCKDPQQTSANQNAWSMYEDRLKNLWVGTCTGGSLYRLNREKDAFEVFDRSLGDAIMIKEDRRGDLWIGTFSRLIKVDRISKKHREFRIGKPVRDIREDKYGNFWVATEGAGLLLFNRESGNYITFSEADGLPDNVVLNIVEDKHGVLWMSTFNGLCKFNPKTQAIKNFYEGDGLQSNQFNYSAALMLKSGEILFGGIKGFNVFYPEEVKGLNNTAKLLLTGMRIDNTPFESGYGIELNSNVYDISSLTLPYDKAMISFDFAALEFTAAEKISYAYYLEGWDKDWNYTGKSRTANYSKLREGTYKFRVKSTNADGEWLNNERVLELIILPPWWRSWWAYCIYVAAIAVAGYIYILYTKHQAELRYQIKLAKLQTEQEKELSEKKLSFFTHVSHEFRTPLTLIINPIKEFLNNSNGFIDSKELIVVYRNARRLLSLVDQLLLFRKSDAESMKVTAFNLVAFSKEVYLCFIQQAKARRIEFVFTCDKDELELYADKEKIEIVLFNLLSNAFKFTPQGGRIEFLIVDAGNCYELKIKDSGPGIPVEVGDKLFDKFYQASDRHSETKPGFGIGLYLVKRFVEHHGGTATYQSMPGEGTTFKVSLLKGKEHFKNLPILESVENSTLFVPELLEDNQFEEGQVRGKADEVFEVATEKSTLLVVDDNDEIRKYIKQIFSASYIVHEASSGEEGLMMARKEIPDIIITDVVMKELSGVELCTRVKEDSALSHIPVIILTSSSSAEIKLKGIEGGADDYITKPFDKNILIARVSNLLKSRSHLQKYFFNQITLRADDSKVSAEYKEFLDTCIAITEKHLLNPDFSIKTLADEIGMSHSSLYKKVKSISGKSINEFIRYIRLRKAAELFINTDCNVNEAVYQIGFTDVKYFREHFAKLFGMKPSEYIKQYRKSFNKVYKINSAIEKI